MIRLFAAGCLAVLLAAAPATAAPAADAPATAVKKFKLTSPDVANRKTIAQPFVFKGFGCEGGNTSPALSWTNAPADTRSFAVSVYDPDAPTGSGWWHWVVYNLPASTASLARGVGDTAGGQLPAGSIQARTDFGTTGYGGPCPPPGAKPHRYVFTVHALKIETLPIPADASPAMVGFMVRLNSLGKASLTARYGR